MATSEAPPSRAKREHGRLRRALWHPAGGFWVRSAETKSLVDTFLVAAVSTILVVRLFLVITGYPKVGGGGLHIAHLLWGGLLMVVALILTTALISRAARHTAVLIGGVGLGLFIDEIGKFVTSNNDYFFRPTYSLIYIILIVVWLVSRRLFFTKPLSPREQLANAIDHLKESVSRPLSGPERARALILAREAETPEELARGVARLLEHCQTVHEAPPRSLGRFFHKLTEWYWHLARKPEFPLAIGIVFTALTALEAYRVFDIARIWVDAAGKQGATFTTVDRAVNGAHLGFSGWMTLASSGLVVVLFLIGLVDLARGCRLRAYYWLEHGLLVSIFLAQVFNFANLQLFAFVILGIDLILFATVRFMLVEEEHHEATKAVLTAPASVPAALS